MHAIFSSTHARTPRVFKYIKRAGCANFRLYLKKSVLKQHDEYEYSPVETALSKFFSLLLTGQKTAPSSPL